jgi:hypothetical protein
MCVLVSVCQYVHVCAFVPASVSVGDPPLQRPYTASLTPCSGCGSHWVLQAVRVSRLVLGSPTGTTHPPTGSTPCTTHSRSPLGYCDFVWPPASLLTTTVGCSNLNTGSRCGPPDNPCFQVFSVGTSILRVRVHCRVATPSRRLNIYRIVAATMRQGRVYACLDNLSVVV